jgi:SAM-dependent methyltransferase
MSDPSWKLFGIEMSAYAAKEAEARCGAHVFVGDLLDAQFPPESFDVITCFHVFEHLYKPQELLAKVREWLKPGGIFCAEMPNIESAGARIFGSYWQALELPRHLYHYSPATLRTFVSLSGLREVSITTRQYVCTETSLRYIFDSILKKVGIHRTPVAEAKASSLAWRSVRKAMRLTILPVLDWLASFFGDGGGIIAILAKDEERKE